MYFQNSGNIPEVANTVVYEPNNKFFWMNLKKLEKNSGLVLHGQTLLLVAVAYKRLCL